MMTASVKTFLEQMRSKTIHPCLVYTFLSTSIYFSESTLPHVCLYGRNIVSRYFRTFLNVEEGWGVADKQDEEDRSPLKIMCDVYLIFGNASWSYLELLLLRRPQILSTRNYAKPNRTYTLVL